MSSPMSSFPRMRLSRRAFRLLPLALALSLSVAAADAPPPPPAAPAPPPPPVAPLAPGAEQSRALEDARRELERAARRLADLHREYGMAAADAGPAPPGPAWPPMAQDRPRIGVVLAQDDVRGVRIAAVTPDGPAAKAGLRSGDRLLAVGARALDAASRDARLSDARRALQALDADARVRLRYERDGKVATATIKPERGERVVVLSRDGRIYGDRMPGETVYPRTAVPGKRHDPQWSLPVPGPAQWPVGTERRIVERRIAHDAPKAPGHDPSRPSVDVLRIGPDESTLLRIEHDCAGDEACAPLPLADAFRWSGLNLAALDAKLGRYFGARDGVLVLGTGPGLEALEPGDVIRKVDGRSVRTPRDVMDTLRGRRAGTEVAVDYLRDRRSASVRVRVPEPRFAEPPPLPSVPPQAAMPPSWPPPPEAPVPPSSPLPPVPPQSALPAAPPSPAPPVPPLPPVD